MNDASTPDSAVAAWLDGVEMLQQNDLNGLMNLTRRCLRYVPVRLMQEERCELSVWQYALTLSGIAVCLLSRAEDGLPAKDKRMFTLYSLDLSGIQSFLYTISSKGALKGLRARSFYLSILMEHLTDTVLEACGLTRMNVVYCGGGKSHLLLPFDDQLTRAAHAVVRQCNDFFLTQFDTALYLSDGWGHAGADALRGGGRKNPLGELFRETSLMISSQKLRRYDGEAFRRLNLSPSDSAEHECAICGGVHGLLTREEDWLCRFCFQLEKFSPALTQDQQTFAVLADASDMSLPLPCGGFLKAVGEDQADRLLARGEAKRLYSVHQGGCRPGRIDLKLGNYQPSPSVTFQTLAEASHGLRRLAVLRADVDNLGGLFAKGLSDPNHPKPFARVSLARYGALSSTISDFFQEEINRVVMETPASYQLTPCAEGEALHRNVSIVYAGGDDLFLVGAWNEVFDAGMAIREAFARYTGGQVTLSCGITLEMEHTPIRIMADHSAVLEEAAKRMDGKAAFGLFEVQSHASDGYVFKGDVLQNSILAKMLPAISTGCAQDEDPAATAFLYHVWELLRDKQAGPMQLPRLAYLLTRHTAGDKAVSAGFAQRLYHWAMESKANRELQAAILLYVYLHRTEM